MVSNKTGKIYNYYVNRYVKWCNEHNFNKESSLPYYKEHLITAQKSSGYIYNITNIISKILHIPFESKSLVSKRNSLTTEEMNRLKEICKRNYQKEEFSLLLLLLLESGLPLKKILNLTKADVENIIVRQQHIPNESMYLFNYLMSISYQKDLNEKFFSKTYHAYLYIFKRRQQQLFPQMPYITFLKVKNFI